MSAVGGPVVVLSSDDGGDGGVREVALGVQLEDLGEVLPGADDRPRVHREGEGGVPGESV
ncbi:hypothetical protein [Streptomyces sp. NPDC021139]|uniref:hypothetical protein n=1 Tax=unclassified Streptomyces TaxID=2593676 RepID=UPI0033FEAFEA